MRCMPNSPRHLLSIRDLHPDDVTKILDRSAEFAVDRTAAPRGTGTVVGLMFFQASTRTRIGFNAATARLGGTAVEIDRTKHQAGMAAHESLEDTARVIGAYCDLLVIRHASVDAVTAMASVAPVPVICGGAGQRFHPTQVLLDLYAIRKHLGRLDSLRIGIAGDIRTSRTAHSLLRALAWYTPREVRLMAPRNRGPAVNALDDLSMQAVSQLAELDASELDVLYMAGMPPGTGEDRLADEIRESFYLTTNRMSTLPQNAIVLCALPRTGDIDPQVDSDPRAAYFQQSADGLFVRMSILEYILSSP